MVYFCPSCGNMLLVGLGETGNQLFCSTCPYIHVIEEPIAKKTLFKVKQTEDVVNWEMATEGEEECTACFVSNSLQFACRTETDAQETVFFKCQGCGNQWTV